MCQEKYTIETIRKFKKNAAKIMVTPTHPSSTLEKMGNNNQFLKKNLEE